MSQARSPAVIMLDGELEIGRREELRKKLRVPAYASSVLLDCGTVSYADSTALAALLAFHKEADKRAVRVAMLVMLPQFQRLLGYAGLQAAFALFTERGAAFTYLSETNQQ